MSAGIIEAIEEYLSRKDRLRHPDGRSDKGNRWYPSDTERCSCCNNVRQPSHSFPWSLMQHCRTRVHIEHLYGLEDGSISRALRKENLSLLVGSLNSSVQDLLEKRLYGSSMYQNIIKEFQTSVLKKI